RSDQHNEHIGVCRQPLNLAEGRLSGKAVERRKSAEGGDAQGDVADLAGLDRGCASPHPHANQPLYAEEDTKTSQRAQPETKARGEGARNRRQEEEPSGTRIVAWLERAKDYARLIGPATA